MANSTTFGSLLFTPSGQPLGYSWVRTMNKPQTDRRAKPKPLNLYSSTSRTTFSSEDTRAMVLRARNPNNPQFNVYELLSAGNVFSPDYNHLIAPARSQLLAKIKGQNVNLAVAMVEMRQSSELFFSLAKDLTRAWKNLRRLKFSRNWSDKTFARKWIEYQFGIAPIISDLEGLCETMGQKLGEGQYISANTRVQDEVYRTSTRNDGYGGTDFLAQRTRISLRLKALYMIRDPKAIYAKQTGFTNALALGWELIPFSFVVDYLVPVGSYISNLDALVGTSDLGFIQTVSIDTACQATARDGTTATLNTLSVSRSTVSRTLSNPVPTYSPSSSLKKVVNGLALLSILRRNMS